MATAASEDAITELAASLSAEDVPVKLRCATCSLIAYNALRLPCCEQNICETCHKELDDVCQVCHHEPLDKSLCTPNKSLRTTTKVFLKRKLLEREKDQKKRESGPTATQAPESSRAIDTAPASTVHGAGGGQTVSAQKPVSATSHSAQTAGELPPVDYDAQASEAKATNHQQSSEAETRNAQAGESTGQDPENDTSLQQASASAQQGGQWAQGGSQNTANSQQGFNQMNGMNNMGGFPMDMSAMMAMGTMPNMIGMGMDPMMMNAMASSMFGGFGGPNMGMGGMNMGMGQSQFGGPWMTDQDSYNGNAQGNARFGNQAGYNMPSHHGNFNQMNQHSYNDFQSGYGRQGFYARGGRGRRGGFRGGYGYGYHHQGPVNQGNYSYGNNNFPNSHHAQTQENLQAAQKDHKNTESDDTNRQTDLETDKQTLDVTAITSPRDSEAKVATEENKEQENAGQGASTADEEAMVTGDDQIEVDKPMPIQSFVSDEPPSRNLVPAQGSTAVGLSNSISTPAQVPRFAEPRVVGVPGAPTGPRALREGRPNTGRSGLAYSRPSNVQASTKDGPRISKSPSPTREPEPPPHSRSHSDRRSHSRSRSLSRERKERRHSHRQRSRSRSRERRQDQNKDRYNEDDYDRTHYDDQEAQRDPHQKHRSRDQEHNESISHSQREDTYGQQSSERRREYDFDHEYADERETVREKSRGNDYNREEGDARYHDRRSRSPSRRQESPEPREAGREGESRKRRDRDDDHDDDHGHGRGHNRRDRHRRKRHRRQRSSSRERGARREPSDREEPRGGEHVASNHSNADRRGSSATHVGSRPPTGPRETDRSRGDDRHRSRRQRHDSSGGQQPATSTKIPEKDPHTLEREARDRERLMKEMQRRATFDGGRAQGGNTRRRSSAQYEEEPGTAPRRERGGRRRR